MAKNCTDEFHEIFSSAQISTGSHQKSAIKLCILYNSMEADSFFQLFKEYTNSILLVDSKIKSLYVERLMEFIGFACFTFKQNFHNSLENSNDEEEDIAEHPFLEKYISYLLQIQNVVNFSVRIRTCQLINKILDHLVETNLSTEFCDKIEEAMLERLNDPKLEVRLEGILALHRFQEIENPLDRIIDMFKTVMEQDKFAKVRCLCVAKIALRRDVIPVILSKLRDVDISVRLAAFTRLTKVPSSLKIEQRRTVLLTASLETSDKIKSYVETTMLPAWLLQFRDNFHMLMKAVRLDANESDVKLTNSLCEYILQCLFRSKPLDVLTKAVGINEYKFIPYEDLNWESSNYWRILVQFIKNSLNLEDQIEDILPELVHFCTYIEGFYKNLPEVKSTTDFLENQFILKQLFTITREYDLSDPIGRSALQHLINKVLSEVVLTLDTVEVIVKNLERIIPKVEFRARYINELISEIIFPESKEEEIKMQLEFMERLDTLKSDMGTTLRLQESAIEEKDYILADTLEKRLDDIKSLMKNLKQENDSKSSPDTSRKKADVATLIKCLDIAAGLLLSPEVTRMTSSLETLKRDTIFELLIHENDTVQAKAMHCYGLLCIIDKKTANDGIHLFFAPISAYQSGQECDIRILLVCIGSIVDLLRVFGTQLIAAPEERTDLSESQREDHQRHFFGGTSLTNIIQGLVDLMDDEQVQVQETAGRGLCSLVLSNIIQSSSLLSRLVLKWCNPYDGSQKLKQTIGVTLQQLPQIPGFHRQWENTIFITLKALVYAPEDSPFCETVNVDDIAKFMVALYGVNLENEELLFHFALRVCLEIRKKPRAKQVPALSKILNLLNLNDENPLIDELLTTCDELRDIMNDTLSIQRIVKFISKLNQIKKYEPRRTRSRNSSDESGDDSDEGQDECNRVQTIEEEEEDDE